MGKYSKEDYEFERNKQEILALRPNKSEQPKHTSVWSYEIEEHRKQKKKEKLMMFGAVCGIMSILYIIVITIIQFL